LIAGAEDKAVKVISSLLLALPMNRNYKVIFLRRPLDQVSVSQAKMIQRKGSGLVPEPGAIAAALEAHRRSVVSWLNSRTSLVVHWVDFPELVAKPSENAQAIVEFLNLSLDAKAMAAVVNAALHRNR
jgi:hypothetical protein